MSRDANLSAEERSLLIAANLIMIGMIVIHDADHLRQAANLCYTIGLQLWLVNISVYVPSLIGLALALGKAPAAAIVTCVNGVLVGAAFAEVHLWRPTIPVWGLWNSNFFVLDVDWVSWTILALTVLVGVLVAMIGAYAAGLRRARLAAPLQTSPAETGVLPLAERS